MRYLAPSRRDPERRGVAQAFAMAGEVGATIVAAIEVAVAA